MSLSNKEILLKVIDKAYPNAMDITIRDGSCKNVLLQDEDTYTTLSVEIEIELVNGAVSDTISGELNTIIFAHDFAKAFWGEELYYADENQLCVNERPAWQYHLQKMVLEEEPLKYLEKFL